MAPTPGTALDQVVERLMAAPELWPELIALTDRESFGERVVALAADWGLPVSAADVGSGLDSRRRAWLERWI